MAGNVRHEGMNPSPYFQTGDSLDEYDRRTAKSKNAAGRPVRLQTKITALAADPASAEHVYCAGASGVVYRVDLRAGAARVAFTCPGGQLTCLAACPDPAAAPAASTGGGAPTQGQQQHLLFAGSWDRSVHSFALAMGRKARTYAGRGGHTDFVKCLATVAYAPGTALLLSGGADRAVVVWDVASGAPLLRLTGPGAMVTSLAVDPVALDDDDGDEGDDDEGGTAARSGFALFAAASDGAVFRWAVRPAVAPAAPGTAAASAAAAAPSSSAPTAPLRLVAEQRPPTALRPHPATVYGLAFAPAPAEPDLWTCSADGTCVPLAREDGWAPDPTASCTHGGHVRCLATGWGPDAQDPETKRAAVLATGGRDEDVCVWDAGSGALRGRFRGHFDEVLSVLVLDAGSSGGGGNDGVHGRAGCVVSAGLDGTVRAWPLAGLAAELADEAARRAEEAARQEAQRDPDGGAGRAAGGAGHGDDAMIAGMYVGAELLKDQVQEGREGGHGAGSADMTAMLTAEETQALEAMMDDPMG